MSTQEGSTSTEAETIEVRRDELETLVEEKVEEATADLREENERLRDRVKDLEDELEARPDLSWEGPEPADLEVEHPTQGYTYPLGGAVANKPSEDVVEDIIAEAIENGDLTKPTASIQEDDVENLLGIQQLARMPESMAERQLDNENHRNTYRARNVWKDIGDYASKTPQGLVLKSGEMTRVLNALEDDGSIDTKTTHRVMDRMVEFSEGIVEKKKPDNEWLIVVPTDFEEKAAEVVGEGDAVVSSGG